MIRYEGFAKRFDGRRADEALLRSEEARAAAGARGRDHERSGHLADLCFCGDRRSGSDPRRARIHIGHARISIEPIGEASLQNLKRRRVPAVAAHQAEHLRALGGVPTDIVARLRTLEHAARVFPGG